MMHFCISPVTFIKEGVEISTQHTMMINVCIIHVCFYVNNTLLYVYDIKRKSNNLIGKLKVLRQY